MCTADEKLLHFLNRCINTGTTDVRIPAGLLENASIPAVEEALRLARLAGVREA